MTTTLYQIEPGFDVIGADNDKIGDVSEIGPNYLLVTKGFIFVHDMYIPTSAITDVRDEDVYLNVTKDQIDAMGWHEPPADTYADQGTDGGWSGESVGTDADAYGTTATTGYAAQPTDDTLTVQRHEEELQAQKSTAQVGEVEVRKDVVEEEQSFEVPVTRERVEVTRRAVDRPATGAEGAFQDGDTLRVPIREEVVEVTKVPRVVEELEIRKVAEQGTETVSGTVRKEQVHVAEDASTTGAATTGTTGTTSTEGGWER